MDPFLHFKYVKLVILSTVLVVFSYCYCLADPNLSASWECSEADNSTAVNSYQTNRHNLLNTLSENVPLHNGFYKATSGKKLNTIYGSGDPNLSASWECSEADNSTAVNSYQTNLNNLLNTLSENVPLHNGFYKATSGKNSNKIYGLVQCRADVSAQDCANCTKESIKKGMSDCPKSNQVSVWFRWCFIRYSVENFFGDLDNDKFAITYNGTRFDDLNTASTGINLMGGLAATAPKQPLMFQTAIVDVGKRGKRFGMAQCTRDMSRSNCGKCLSSQAEFFAIIIGNKTGIDVYGNGCRMWYNDYQFYFNISTTATNGAKRSSENKGAAVGITLATLGFLSVL